MNRKHKKLNKAFEKFVEKLKGNAKIDPKFFALADLLEKKHDPNYAKFIERCRSGMYDDFATKIAMPKTQMVVDAQEIGRLDIVMAINAGDYDQ